MQTRRRGTVLPAEELLHPLPLLAVALLALNDHVLKGSGALPGWLTGKLSDVLGLFFFPLLLTALWRIALWLTGRRRPLTRTMLGAAIALTAIGFTALQLLPQAALAYEQLMPRLDPTGVVRRVRVTQDPTDLVALGALALTWLHGRRLADRSDLPDGEGDGRAARKRPPVGGTSGKRDVLAAGGERRPKKT